MTLSGCLIEAERSTLSVQRTGPTIRETIAMTIEVLDMPDVTELRDDTGVSQQSQRVTTKLDGGATGLAVRPPTTGWSLAEVTDPLFYRKRDRSE
jgi:hypothetical protein